MLEIGSMMLKKSNIKLLKAKKLGNKKMIFEVKKELALHKLEMKAINMSGKKKGVEKAQKAMADAKIAYGKALILSGQGSDAAFKALGKVK